MAEALKTLKEAVMASQLISEDKKQEHIEVINQFGEESLSQLAKTLLPTRLVIATAREQIQSLPREK